jgi:hypothetical protein
MTRRTRVRTLFVLLMVIPFLLRGHAGAQGSAVSVTPNNGARSSCPVTIPRKSPLRPSDMWGSGSAHWQGKLFVGGLWPDGTILFRRGDPNILPDGSLRMKFGWYRAPGLQGKIIISGRRLDGRAPGLRSNISDDGEGFAASALIFPTEGCWEVMGQVREVNLTFVTRVVKSEEDQR